MKKRKREKKIYNSGRWRRLRATVLDRFPTCNYCFRLATVVDHIKPISQGGDPWDLSNLQPLCAKCHSGTKQKADKAALGNPDFKTGWPSDPEHPSNL